jgi:hypothetical protein
MISLAKLIFVFLFPSILLGWNVSPESLEKKLNNPLTEWAKNRIATDLTAYKKGVIRSQIPVCLQKLKKLQPNLLLVEIIERKGRFIYTPLSPLTKDQESSVEHFISALSLLHTIKPLPLLHFVLSLEPFDRPILLKEITIPIFAVNKEKGNSKTVLIPRLFNCERENDFLKNTLSWSEKISKGFWRGAPSDGAYTFFEWDMTPRAHLAIRFKNDENLIDAKLVLSDNIDPGIKNWMSKLNLVSTNVSPKNQSQYKYLISLDGRSSPSSFEWQLFTKSLIFKGESNKIEWFYDGLKPNTHYISFHSDGGDLAEKLRVAQQQDKASLLMGEKSYAFALQHLLDEECFVYLYKLLETYSTLFRQQ